MADLAAALGDGWTEVDDTPIGQAFLRMMLEYHGIGAQEARDGDRGLGRRPGRRRDRSGRGLRSRLAPGLGHAARMPTSSSRPTPPPSPTFDFEASVIELGSGEVLVAHGSDVEILRRTVDAAAD